MTAEPDGVSYVLPSWAISTNGISGHSGWFGRVGAGSHLSHPTLGGRGLIAPMNRRAQELDEGAASLLVRGLEAHVPALSRPRQPHLDRWAQDGIRTRRHRI